MRHRLILFISLDFALAYFCAIGPSYAQLISTDVITRQVLDLKDDVNFRKMTIADFEEIQGSPYLSESFQPGAIHFRNGQVYSAIPLRFNIYLNEIQYQADEGIYTLTNNQAIDFLVIGRDTLVYERYDKGEEAHFYYFSRLVNGATALLKKMNVELVEAQPAKPMLDPVKAHFKQLAPSYYVKLKEGVILPVKSIKKLAASFDKHQSAVKDYAKKNRISPHNEQELTNLIHYYNQIY